MSRSIKINLGLSEDKTLKIKFPLPQNLLEFLNYSTYVLVGIYLLTVFSSYLFQFSRYGELDVLLFSYVFLLVFIGIHFTRFLLGGEIFFSKVAYDIIILVIPPVVIMSLMLSGGTEIDTFGKYGTWAIAAITILSSVMSAYLFALNFSNKAGEKFLQRFFDIGLIIGGIIYILVNNFEIFEVDISTVYINFIIAVLAPAYLLRLYNKKVRITERVTSILLLLLSIYFYSDMITVFRSELEARAYFSFYKVPVIQITLSYLLFTIIFLTYFLYKRKFNLLGYFKELNKRVNKSLTGRLKSDIVRIFSEVWGVILGIIVSLFVVISTLGFIIPGYVKEFFADAIENWKTLTDIGGVKELLIGTGLSNSGIHPVSIIFSYGLVPVLIFLAMIGYILFKELKNINYTKLFEDKNLFRLILFAGLILWSLVFDFNVMIMFIFWFVIGQMMIANRESELKFDKVKIVEFSSIKDPQYRTLVASFRFILILVVVIGVAILVNSLFDALEGNLFYADNIVN